MILLICFCLCLHFRQIYIYFKYFKMYVGLFFLLCKQTFSLCLIFSQQTFPLQLRGMFHVKLRPFYPQDLASRMAVGQHGQIQLVRTRRAG